MRIGLLSDIHEDVEALDWAVGRLHREDIDRLICLGDVCEDGTRIAETCARLAAANVECVWGNHDYGLCTSPREQLRGYFADVAIDYMQSCVPELVIEDCAFRHIEPCLDANDLAQLWHEPDDFRHPDRLARNLAAARVRRTFMGHLHGWHALSENGALPWSDSTPLQTGGPARFLVVIAAVRDGHCAWLDTTTGELRPYTR
jgi:hypothetical protein